MFYLEAKNRTAISTMFVFQAILFVFLQSGRSEMIRRSAFFNTENVKLESNEIISRQTSRSVLSCSQKCLSEPLCLVFNYGSSSVNRGICELYKTSSDGLKLIHEPGWLCGHLHGPKKVFKGELAYWWLVRVTSLYFLLTISPLNHILRSRE